MKKEKLIHFAAAATLPLALFGNVSCGGGAEESSSAPVVETPVSVVGGNDLINEIVNKYGGVVIFSVMGYNDDLNMIVKFNRVDLQGEENNILDHDSQRLTASQADDNGIIYALFPATSCKGKYELSISLDNGQIFTQIPVPDLKTRIPSDTFELTQDTCVRPITLDLSPNEPV